MDGEIFRLTVPGSAWQCQRQNLFQELAEESRHPWLPKDWDNRRINLAPPKGLQPWAAGGFLIVLVAAPCLALLLNALKSPGEDRGEKWKLAHDGVQVLNRVRDRRVTEARTMTRVEGMRFTRAPGQRRQFAKLAPKRRLHVSRRRRCATFPTSARESDRRRDPMCASGWCRTHGRPWPRPTAVSHPFHGLGAGAFRPAMEFL